MVKKLGTGVSLTLTFGVMSVWSLLFAYSCSGPPTDSFHTNPAEPTDQIDALGANAACYVCHIRFVKEQISKVHLSKDITCIHCHGLSASHANDENVGATLPDITFERDEVDILCLKCHTRHTIPSVELSKYQSHPVCTDCHGSHRLNGPAG